MKRFLTINSLKVSEYMAKECLNITDLANKVGFTKSYMSLVLSKKQLTPKAAGRLAKALNCDVSEIIVSDQTLSTNQ